MFDSPPSPIAVPTGYLTTTLLAILGAMALALRASARASTHRAVEEPRER